MFLGLQQPLPCVDEDLSGNVGIAEVQKSINMFLGLLPVAGVLVADAGKSQSVVTETVVILDGSGSHDSNNKTLTYHWAITIKPVGSAAVHSSATVIQPTFMADLPGNYTFNLVVNNGEADSPVASVTITAAGSTGSILIRW
jgi:PKD repeat protein